VLQRLAGAFGADYKDEKVDLEAWTEEIRTVVKKASAKLDKDTEAKKERAKKRVKKAKKNEDDEEEANDSCDEL